MEQSSSLAKCKWSSFSADFIPCGAANPILSPENLCWNGPAWAGPPPPPVFELQQLGIQPIEAVMLLRSLLENGVTLSEAFFGRAR